MATTLKLQAFSSNTSHTALGGAVPYRPAAARHFHWRVVQDRFEPEKKLWRRAYRGWQSLAGSTAAAGGAGGVGGNLPPGDGGGHGGGGGSPGSPGEGSSGIPIFLICMVSAAVASAAAQHRQADGSKYRAVGDRGSSSSSSSSSTGRERPPASVSVIVPALNEEKGIRDTLRYLKSMSPPPKEVIVVDGGSSDGTIWAARQEGARVVRSGRGRGRQMNSGADVATGDILMFVHADTRPPHTAVAVARAELADPRAVIGGFNTLVQHNGRILWYLSGFHFVKTYAAPLLFRPLSFARGLRCLFGDQSLFVRAADFRQAGGFDGRLAIMEDLDLIIRLHMAGPGGGLRGRGRVVHVLSPVNCTSGRRLGVWGNLKSTYVSARISWEWYWGASPERIRELYRTLWTDQYR